MGFETVVFIAMMSVAAFAVVAVIMETIRKYYLIPRLKSGLTSLDGTQSRFAEQHPALMVKEPEE